MNKTTNVVLFIVLSVAAIYFIGAVHVAVHWIDSAHQFILSKLSILFAGDQAGRIIRTSLAMILIPLIIALIPTFIYWLIRRTMMPHFMTWVWIVWFVLLTILAYR